MKYIVIFTLILSAFISEACRSKQNRQSETSDSKTAETVIDKAPDNRGEKSDVRDSVSSSSAGSDTAAQVFKGLYSYGRKNSTFRSCANLEKPYVVKDNTQKLSGLYRKVLNNRSYEGESIYAEVKGHLQSGADEKDSVLVVTEVLKTEAKSFTTACYQYEFILMGTEPFWGAEIIPFENRIVLHDASTDRVFIFPFKKGRKGRGGVYVYETNNARGESLRIVIRPGTCSDGMSERTYNYSAEVRLGNDVFKGCAIKKGDPIKE